MRYPTEREFFDVLEADAVDRAFAFMRAGGFMLCENCLSQALARTLIETLFPFVRDELKHPQRSYHEIAEFVESAILTALQAAALWPRSVKRWMGRCCGTAPILTSAGRCATNPLDRVDRARKPAREITSQDRHDGDVVGPDNILDPTEIRRLLEAANPGLDRTLFLTAFVTGAREGELLALRWADVELTTQGSGKMAIRRSLSWARLKGEEMRPRYFPPKTKAGRRVIHIPDELVTALKRWKLQCPQSEEDLVFPTPDGQPLCRDRLLRTRFYPALARARLRRVTFRSLRHSCASAMIADGAAITEVQNQLGHSNPSITLGIYSHWFKNAKAAARRVGSRKWCWAPPIRKRRRSGH